MVSGIGPILIVAGVVSVLLAAVFGWQAGAPPRITGSDTIAEEDWSLPGAPVEQLNRAADILAKRRPWGGETAPSPDGAVETGPETSAADADAAEPPAPQWRLGGTVDGDYARFVIIAQAGEGGDEVRYVGLGELLPDGSQVMAIDPGRITVLRDGREQQIRLFERPVP